MVARVFVVLDGRKDSPRDDVCWGDLKGNSNQGQRVITISYLYIIHTFMAGGALSATWPTGHIVCNSIGEDDHLKYSG